LASETEEQGSGSFFAWVLFLAMVVGVPVSVFVWMGGMRLLRRKFGKGKERPDSRKDGYMRVDLEK